MRHTTPIPSRNELFSPVHIFGLGWIFQRCVGICPIKSIKWCHRFSFSWTWYVNMTQCPLVVFIDCCSIINIPYVTYISSMAKQSSKQNHELFETHDLFCGMAANMASSLSRWIYGTVDTFSTVLVSQEINFFLVLHLLSYLARFFTDMVSYMATSTWLLGQNRSSMDWKR